MKSFKQFHIILLLPFLMSCKAFVDIDPPKNLVVSKSVFTTDETAVAAVVGIYAQMSKENIGYNLSSSTGLAGDELKNYSTNQYVAQFYQNVPLALDAYSNGIWNELHSYIYQANAILEGVEQSLTLSAFVAKQLVAEAHFIRAFSYFYLVNLYGDVPLLTSTGYEKNRTAERLYAGDVYRQIKDDLELAVANLSKDYISASGLGTTPERVRPNQFTALALLARVNLFMGNWETAQSNSALVIAQTSLYDTVAINDAFLVNNKEAIWQLQLPSPPPISNMSTFEASRYVLTTRPATIGSFLSNTVSANLLERFQTRDKRLSGWIGHYTDDSETPHVDYFFPYKYKIINEPQPTERLTVFRLAEQYLIRAEAAAHLNNISQAKADLNVVRKRAGLEEVNISSKEELLAAILHERQLELFTEWGHRWLDLKRTNTIDGVMKDVLPHKGGGAWKPEMALWPIPQSEIENNPNLKQNIGYQ